MNVDRSHVIILRTKVNLKACLNEKYLKIFHVDIQIKILTQQQQQKNAKK